MITKNSIENNISKSTGLDNPMFADYTYETNDYSIFKYLLGNRAINKNGVYEKVKSIQSMGYIKQQAILVTTDFYIVDGQHRFEACKELSLPIFYRIIDKHSTEPNLLDFIRAIQNTQRKWSNKDSVDSFIRQGNSHYQILKDFHEKYSINYSVLSVFFGGNAQKEKANSIYKNNQRCITSAYLFHSGKIVTNKTSIEKVTITGNLLNLIRDLRNVKQYETSWVNQSDLVGALWTLVNSDNELFGVSTFKAKLKTNHEKIVKQKDRKTYVEMFMYIYNLRNKKPMALKGYRDYMG
jgi:hypothetical protein